MILYSSSPPSSPKQAIILISGFCFIAEYMVEHCRARIAISAYGHALVNAIGVSGYDVKGLVEHASRFGDEAHASWSVKLRGDDVLDGSRQCSRCGRLLQPCLPLLPDR